MIPDAVQRVPVTVNFLNIWWKEGIIKQQNLPVSPFHPVKIFRREHGYP